jgi:hypothetical protein
MYHLTTQNLSTCNRKTGAREQDIKMGPQTAKNTKIEKRSANTTLDRWTVGPII